MISLCQQTSDHRISPMSRTFNFFKKDMYTEFVFIGFLTVFLFMQS